MALFEDVVLKDSIKIKTSPERIFNFLTSITDNESYRAWHKEDHVSFKWIKGTPWAEGSILLAEEYIHGKLHRLRFIVTEIVQNKKIVYSPTSRFVRKFFPKNEFVIEQEGDHCHFIALVTLRVGKIGRILFKKSLEKSLFSVRKHMSEEGENLKYMLEAE